MASRNSGCAVTSRRSSSMSRQRTRAPSQTPLSPTAMLPSPETRRRSTSVLGAASRKARTGIRLCPPAMTVASGSDASRSIASRSTSADITKILGLRPDVVLTFSDLQADIVAALIRQGASVHAFNQRTIAEIFDMIRMLGALVGAADRAGRLVGELE